MLGLAASLSKGGASLLTFVKDNLKLYLDFKSNRSDTLAFPSEGSTSFDGDNDYITIGDDTTLDITSAITMSCWIKPMEIDAHSFVAGRDDGTNRNYYLEVYTDEKFYWTCNGLSDTAVASTTTFTSGTWYHIAGVYDGANMILYVNGVAEDTDASTGSIDNDDVSFTIGAREAGADRFFKGNISNLGLWSRALSLEEINSVMNKSYSQLGSVEKTSLVAWWALDSATTGSNLIADSGFDDASYWNAGSGWSVNGTTASKAVGADAWSVLQRSSLLKSGVTYRLTADIRRLSGIGFFRFYAQSNFGTNMYPYDLNGDNLATYTQDLVSNTDGNPAIRIGGSALSIEVDNFTVQELNIHTDSHGSNNGSNVGATTTTSVYGGNAPILPRAIDIAESFADAIGNGSASFNGSSDYVQIGNNPSAPLTISFWFNPSSSASGNPAIYSTTGALEIWIGYHVTDGWIRGHFGGAAYIQTPNSVISANRWYYVAITLNGTTGKIYINGINQSLTTSGTLSSPDVSVSNIGRRTDNNGNLFTGKISQFGIWQGALTQSQVQEVFESTSYQKIPASVKSTLGSEILTTNVNTDWNAYGSNDVDTVTGGVKITHDNNASGAARVIAGSSTKLYKVVFNAYYSGGTAPNVKVWTGAVNSGTQALTTSSTQHTIYFVNAGTSSLYFDSVNGSQEIFITNLSAKEVTNDLLAYYPLDADSEVKGLSFDGNDNIATNVNSTPADATYIWWMKSTATNTNPVFGHGTSSQTGFILNWAGTNKPLLYLNSSNYRYFSLNDAQDDGAWHCFALVNDNDDITNAKLYIDGVEQSATSTTSTGADPTHAHGLKIGYAGSYFNGSIAQFAVYSDLKDSPFITSKFNQGIGADLSSDSNLTAYYKMDNATTVVDNSSNSNNGTVNGATLISAGTTDSVGNNDGELY